MLRLLWIVVLSLLGSLALGDELIIFHMPGCRPCAHLKAMLDENPELIQGFKVSRVDILADEETAKLFAVSSVPTVVRLDEKDREMARQVGYDGKRAFENWLKNPHEKKTFIRKTPVVFKQQESHYAR